MHRTILSQSSIVIISLALGLAYGGLTTYQSPLRTVSKAQLLKETLQENVVLIKQNTVKPVAVSTPSTHGHYISINEDLDTKIKTKPLDEKPIKTVSKFDIKIKKLMSTMSIQDKAAQMIIVYHSPSSYMLKHRYGGSLVMSPSLKKPDELKTDIALMQKKMPIPVLITTDQEGGSVDRLQKLADMSSMKSAAQMGKMNPTQILEYTKPWGQKLNDLGINTNLAPVLDPAKDWKNNDTFMFNKNRSFGENSDTVIKSANAFMDGFKSQKIICITKHFPGYDVQTNSDHELAQSQADSAHVAREIEIFAATSKHAGGVMMTSIHFSKFSDRPAVFDPKIVGWARQYFPNAIIMTDDLWGMSLRAFAAGTTTVGRNYSNENLKKLTMLAFDAGNDMLMMTYPAMAEKMIKMISNEAKRNPRRKVLLDQAVYRILNVKFQNEIIK